MMSFKSSLSFVAGCFTEAFVGGAELVACVAVTGYEIVTVGVAEGVEVARETYATDMEAAVVAAEVVVAEVNEANVVAAEAASAAAAVAVRTFTAAVADSDDNFDYQALDALRVAAEEATAIANAAQKVVADAVAQQAAVVPVVAPVGIIARTRAVLHAAWSGVGAGVRASYEVAPVLWKDHYGTVVVNHTARVAARKAAPAVVEPVVLEADVIQEADGTYATVEVVDVNDITVEARVATAFAIFGMILTRMISTVVRVVWTVIKVAVRIVTFPVRKMFTITRRTRTHTAA